MRNLDAGRQTRVLTADSAGIAEAAAIVRRGGLLAFPTETVYGLGTDARDAGAVRSVFTAKGRPAEDPLIVHLAELADLAVVAEPSSAAWQLAERFWPGPLTLVLRKTALIPDAATAGLDTVAVRVPSHPIARALLQAARVPIAAPSANLFGRPSPTRAAHVLHDLSGRIDAVLDGGPTTIGLESTIVGLANDRPCLLRPGGVAVEDIEAVLGERLVVSTAAQRGPQPAPGMLASHYAPRTPLVLITGSTPDHARRRLQAEVTRAVTAGRRVGVLALEDDRELLPAAAVVEVVGPYDKPERSAERLFDALRSLDRKSLEVLFARDLADPYQGLGRALADRLARAAGRVIDARAD